MSGGGRLDGTAVPEAMQQVFGEDLKTDGKTWTLTGPRVLDLYYSPEDACDFMAVCIAFRVLVDPPREHRPGALWTIVSALAGSGRW